MGLVYDGETDRCRVCHRLIFTACLSRHCFVWLTFAQTTEAVIEGFKAAWALFGVFATVIPDNLMSIPRFEDICAEVGHTISGRSPPCPVHPIPRSPAPAP